MARSGPESRAEATTFAGLDDQGSVLPRSPVAEFGLDWGKDPDTLDLFRIKVQEEIRRWNRWTGPTHGLLKRSPVQDE
jgi:hypothetical protein